MSKTIKFYTGDLSQYVLHPDVPQPEMADPGVSFQSANTGRRDLHSIRVYESESFDGVYTLIDTVRIQPGADYIYAQNASSDYLHRWYRLEFVTDPDGAEVTTLGRTEPVVPEDIATLVDDVRDWLGDTDPANPAWSERHYIQNIRTAVKQHIGNQNLSYVRDDDIVPIQLLVREIYAMAIAYDHAKYYELQAPAATLDKSQIMAHYLQVAEGLRQQYDAMRGRLNLQSGGYGDDGVINQMPAPNVVNAKRYSKTTGREVSSIGPSRRRRNNYFYDSVV